MPNWRFKDRPGPLKLPVAGNIYAPYYRQADAMTCLSLPLEEQDELLRGVTKSDVFASFNYFIKQG